jgi:3-hydroxy-9,10-secoandrosta-1,3,5(10)-triene-9,17-dione monooxygenase
MNAAAAEALVPSEAVLVERAKALVPVLRSRSTDCQAARMVSAATIEDFRKAGFFRILQSKRYGGYEHAPTTLYKVLQTLASGCPSSSWVLMVIAVHNLEIEYMDPRCGADIWGSNTDVRMSSSYVPFGKVKNVDGGFALAGRWHYSSGSDHCDWALLGGMVDVGFEFPEWKAFLIPRSDYTIDQDSWNVFGLAGSGSKDIVLKGEVFVPAYRCHTFVPARGQLPPPKPAHLPLNFKFPFDQVFRYAVASVNLGMAVGALEVFREQMRGRTSHFNPSELVTSNPWMGHRVGVADVKVACAKALIEADFAEMRAGIEAGIDVSTERYPHLSYHATYVGQLAEESVHYLFKATGARGMSNLNPLQMFLRDVQAGTRHIVMDADSNSVVAGGHYLGGGNT